MATTLKSIEKVDNVEGVGSNLIILNIARKTDPLLVYLNFIYM